jgi:hypothetical protein
MFSANANYRHLTEWENSEKELALAGGALIIVLLGILIFIWFIILHIPDVIASSPVDLGDQVTSAFLAFAYSGIAFVNAGAVRKNLT